MNAIDNIDRKKPKTYICTRKGYQKEEEEVMKRRKKERDSNNF